MVQYEKHYHNYFHQYLINDEQHYLLRSRLSLENYFKQEDIYKKVLEYGVGLGQNIFLIEDKSGFDISTFALEFSKTRGINMYSSVNEIPNKSFDIVLLLPFFRASRKSGCSFEIDQIKDLNWWKARPSNTKKIHKRARFEMSDYQHFFAWNFRIINNLLIQCGFNILENKGYAGTGFYKLKLLSNINFKIWKLATSLLRTILNRKELVMVATNQ